MERIQKIDRQLQRLVAVPQWRFAIGLRIRFNHPTLLYQTYPEKWVSHYSRNGLLFVDPAVGWGMTNTGMVNWDDLTSSDPAGVFSQAAEHGLRHGIVVSVGELATRSLGFFASSDGPIPQNHRALADEVVQELHGLSQGMEEMDPADLAPFAALNDQLRSTSETK